MKSGKYVVNGIDKTQYKSFKPSSLYDFDFKSIGVRTFRKLCLAYEALGEFNAIIDFVKSKEIFIYSYVRLEALNSSVIEGTEATIEDLFDSTISINDDIEETICNVKAIEYGAERLKSLPICNRFIKEINKELLTSTRGKDKTPGEFRHSQNWIGGIGSNLDTASYIPPNVVDMNEAMNDLEKYMNDESVYMEPLINSALIHYQFETIHPFLDGNGRTGRMLVLLYLYERCIIKEPCLYLSYYLKKNQNDYYYHLKNVREKDAFDKYVSFYLDGIIFTAKDAVDRIKEIIKIRETNKNRLVEKDYWLLDYIEKHPIFNSSQISADLKLDYQYVNRTIKRYIDIGIVEMTKKSKKRRLYEYSSYLDILRK